MFLSAIIKAHSDGLAEHAEVSADHDEAAAQAATDRTGDSVIDAVAAREKRLIELPAIHRARWL